MVKIKIYKIQMINNKIEGKFEIVIDEILLHNKYPKNSSNCNYSLNKSKGIRNDKKQP